MITFSSVFVLFDDFMIPSSPLSFQDPAPDNGERIQGAQEKI